MAGIVTMGQVFAPGVSTAFRGKMLLGGSFYTAIAESSVRSMSDMLGQAAALKNNSNLTVRGVAPTAVSLLKEFGPTIAGEKVGGAYQVMQTSFDLTSLIRGAVAGNGSIKK